MGRNILRIFIGFLFILHALATQYQPSVKQYIIRGHSPQTSSVLSSQSYNQQPVIIERISVPTGSYDPSGSMVHGGSFVTSGSYDPNSRIASGSIVSNGLYDPNPFISSSSLVSTNSYDPNGSIVSSGLYDPSSILSTGSLLSSGSVIPSSSINSNALYEYIGSSGTFLSNGQIVTNNPGCNSQFISGSSVPNPMLSQINVNPGQITDVSGVLNGLQSLKSIASQGFGGITPPPQPQSDFKQLENFKNPLQNGPKLDSTVLNNLAIALQLLILSNMLNAEETETLDNNENSLFEIIEPLAVKNVPNSNYNNEPYYNNEPLYPQKQKELYEPNYQKSEPMYPNCNFVGSSGFADTNPIFGPQSTAVFPPTHNHPNSRTKSNALMSPYEALGNTHECFYGTNKLYDPMSPFSDNNDLFSMSDFSF